MKQIIFWILLLCTSNCYAQFSFKEEEHYYEVTYYFIDSVNKQTWNYRIPHTCKPDINMLRIDIVKYKMAGYQYLNSVRLLKVRQMRQSEYAIHIFNEELTNPKNPIL
jgi:hypothetical protein